MSKQLRKREEKRRRILEAAAELFFDRGYSGTTMNAICEKLGVTKPFVYYYFDDKMEILEALSFDAAETTFSSLRKGAEGEVGAERRLRAGLSDFIAAYVKQFISGSLYAREEPYFSPESRTRMRRMARSFREDLIGLLQDAVDAGVLPAQDVNFTASIIGSMVGHMYTWYRPRGRLSPTEIGREMLDRMLRAAGYAGEKVANSDPAPAPGRRTRAAKSTPA